MPVSSRRGFAYKSSRSPYAKPKPQRRARGAGQYINPARFVQVAAPVTADSYEAKHVFADFAFDKRLHANIATKGYVAPTPIQDQTIALGLAGKDVIGIASTGTGKTAAFALPILHRLMADQNSKALIVAPTRELAQQIEAECRDMGKGGGFSGALLLGGMAYGPQLRDLRAGPRLVIGTPGRIKDHIDQNTLKLDGFNLVVLDEVDRMLDMGFVNDVRLLLSQLAVKRQSFYFSATMDTRVTNLIHTFSPDAEMVTVRASTTSENVHQDVMQFSGKTDKQEKLHDILLQPDTEKAIIFEGTQRSVERLENDLTARGFHVASIHGGKSQSQRARALKSFKDNTVKILVATDVAARGLDVIDITHVINYTQPQTYDDYIHRIGRAGRAGRIGYAYTFVEK
ncbi:DEAD/DEAH box helicase [Candidatus Saccharibacteria bacterium]|nr:MAG: DEAD/DEAH box helicase [Candidatus Saccharibacteria bacterium]